MIIKNTPTLQEYLSVNGSIDIDNVKPALRKAERNYLKPFIGTAQLAVFEAEVTDPIIREALALAQEAVANFGYYLHMPIGALQVSDNGFYTVDSENTKTATDKQFKELQRSLLRGGHEALDDLLSFMEENAAKFEPWTTSASYTVYKDLLVKDTATFNSYYHIFNSRQTFLALRPNIKVVEDQFIKPVIGDALLRDLKSDQTEETRKEVKKLLQQSIVAFTIMKTVYNGLFVMDAAGMHMRFDLLPYETTGSNSNTKGNDFLEHTEKSKQIEGEEYLKMALNIIKENTADFPEYTTPEVAKVDPLIKTKGLVGM
ncbi:hypothetical protein HCG49_17050 [Arenibacter sp. 6A1]|uniref:DUF6712 family protein n=1 Tax=Arenibacter sp. 6A1 TaxID=2720391 RepID=UPI001445ECCD|nr:DUF6712 family protein [Arenibacter sp. 6A1]NKI28264.1 hypothetical protein [Arenibacter sp. 6A1]